MCVGKRVLDRDILGPAHSRIIAVHMPFLCRLNHETTVGDLRFHPTRFRGIICDARLHFWVKKLGTVALQPNPSDTSRYQMYKQGFHSPGYLADAEGCYYCFQELSNPKG